MKHQFMFRDGFRHVCLPFVIEDFEGRQAARSNPAIPLLIELEGSQVRVFPRLTHERTLTITIFPVNAEEQKETKRRKEAGWRNSGGLKKRWGGFGLGGSMEGWKQIQAETGY
jgi:hypothetical protein